MCVESLSRKPNLIPEGEQRLRRSRTRDEREPSGFPLIPRFPDIALAAGFTPAATLFLGLSIDVRGITRKKSKPYTGG